MNLMAHRFPSKNVLPPEQSLSMVPPRGEVSYRSYYRHELNPLHAEELLRKKERARKAEGLPHPVSKQWINEAEMRNMRPDLQKREWLLQAEQQEQEYQARKQLEQDAYYRANQEYVRLMKENQSRQSFREKQRLTEDLEKQKRLLIEDLARDQQLLQDKYKRNQSALDPRGKHAIHEKVFRPDLHLVRERDHVTTRGLPRPSHPYAVGREDPRVSHTISALNDRYSMGHIPVTLMQNKELVARGNIKHHPDASIKQQCQHSDLTHGHNSLIPIIQEKERKIKEMEEKLSKFTQEQKVLPQQGEFKDSEKQNMFATKAVVVSNTDQKFESTAVVTDSSADFPNDNLIIDVIGETGDKATLSENEKYAVEEKTHGTNEEKVSAKKLSSDNVTEEVVVLDEKKPHMELDAENKVNIDVNNYTLIEGQPNNSDEFTASESRKSGAVDRNMEKVGNPKIKENLVSEIKETSETQELEMEPLEDGKVAEGDAEAHDKDNGKPPKKKQKQKVLPKKTGEDFQASQSRVALDLPNHNWLVEKLMQQNKLGANDVAPNAVNRINFKDKIAAVDQVLTSSKDGKDEKTDVPEKDDINEIQILSVMSLKNGQKSLANDGDDNVIPVSSHLKQASKKGEQSKNLEFETNTITSVENGNEIDQKSKISSDKANKNIKCKVDDVTSTSNDKIKDSSIHSTLLLKLLHPKETSIQETSPNRINPPEIVNSAAITSAFKAILPKDTKPTSSSPPMLIKNHDSTPSEMKNKAKENESNSGAFSQLETLITKKISVSSTNSPAMNAPLIKSPILVQSSSAPPSRLPHAELMKTKIPRRAHSETGNRSENLTMYQDIRPNLVLMTRRESENQMYPNSGGSPSTDASQYNKLVIEERYNRKRILPEERQETATVAELERNAKIRKLIEMQHRKEGFVPDVSYQERRSKHEQGLIEERYLYPRQELQYGIAGRALPADALGANLALSATAGKPTDFLEEQMHHARMQRSPSAYIQSRLSERPPERSYPLIERRLDPALKERLGATDGRLKLPLDPRAAPVNERLMLEQLREHERERLLLEESRKQESLHRVGDVSHLHRPSPIPVKLEQHEILAKDRFAALNERVRTVDDLRYLQMGLTLENPYRQNSKRAHLFRNERLTEREKLALREAELSSNASAVKQENLASRHNIHRTYLEHVKHDSAGLPKHVPVHVLSSGQLSSEILELRKREEEEKLRLLSAKGSSRGFEGREALMVPVSEMTTNPGELGPRFYSHKIPRTRNGSLDFGRSKPVDYSFLDYTSNMQRPEAIPVEGIRRPNSIPSSEDWRLARRGAQQNYVSAELYKRLSQNELKQSESCDSSEKWTKTPNSPEKQICKICGKDAQYLCSGCRKAWYCSQECQLSEWRTHSRTCAAER